MKTFELTSAKEKKMTTTPIKQTRIVSCPRCKKSARYDENNPYRPFCSPLCKNEDIIAWAKEDYKVPGPALDEEEEALPQPDEIARSALELEED